jgi:hypothetical protein
MGGWVSEILFFVLQCITVERPNKKYTEIIKFFYDQITYKDIFFNILIGLRQLISFIYHLTQHQKIFLS